MNNVNTREAVSAAPAGQSVMARLAGRMRPALLAALTTMAACGDGITEMECPDGKVQVFRNGDLDADVVACASNGETRTATCEPGQRARVETIDEAQSSENSTGNNTVVVICEGATGTAQSR